MSARDAVADLLLSLFGCITAFFWLAARTQTGTAELDDLVGRTARQSLCVGVRCDELNALHTALDHVFNRIAAAAANANHFDLCALVKTFFNFNHFDGHGVLLFEVRFVRPSFQWLKNTSVVGLQPGGSVVDRHRLRLRLLLQFCKWSDGDLLCFIKNSPQTSL